MGCFVSDEHVDVVFDPSDLDWHRVHGFCDSSEVRVNLRLKFFGQIFDSVLGAKDKLKIEAQVRG